MDPNSTKVDRIDNKHKIDNKGRIGHNGIKWTNLDNLDRN